MKKKALTVVFFLCNFYCLFGQSFNLISNPSFEFFYGNASAEVDTSLATDLGPICWASGNANMGILYRHVGTNVFPNLLYFPTFFYGNHLPRTGQSYITISQLASGNGIDLSDSLADYRGMLQCRLLQPLEAGVTYKFSVWLAGLTDTTFFCPNILTWSPNIGVYFSVTRPTNFTSYKQLPVSPQVKTNSGNFQTDVNSWVEWNGNYVAVGGEEYLTIGNFDAYSSSVFNTTSSNCFLDWGDIWSYINIDDISLYRDTATSFINTSLLDIGSDTILCSPQTFPYTLTAQPDFFHYLWSTGDTSASITVTNPGLYWCSVDFGCNWFTDSIMLLLDSSFNHLLVEDTALCNSQFPFAISPSADLPNYLWSNGDTTSSIVVDQPGIFWLQTTTPCNTHLDSIVVTLKNGNYPGFPDLVLCDGATDTVFAPEGVMGIQWSTGSTDSFVIVTESGKHSLAFTDDCGTYTYEFEVKLDSAPKILLPDTLTLCEGHSVTLDAGPDQFQYIWSTGDTVSYLQVETGGTYKVVSFNTCGLDSASAEVVSEDCSRCFAIPNAFTPNGDGLNDEWKVIALCNDVHDFDLTIFNRWGEAVFKSGVQATGWNGEFQSNEMAIGSYIYYLTYRVTETQVRYTQKGAINLLR